ncbi:MAG: hypothetical protein Q8P05_05455 [Candidatus Diapherotrites archaeon]|nr:hypothetical protein [Candidatus Diapherotrites archaeon]
MKLLLGALFLVILSVGCVNSTVQENIPQQAPQQTVQQIEDNNPIPKNEPSLPILECIFPSDSVNGTEEQSGYGQIKHSYTIKMLFKNSNDADIQNVVVTIKTDMEKVSQEIKWHYGTSKIYPVGTITAHSTVEKTFDWHEESYWGGGDVKFIVTGDNAQTSEECGPATGRDVVIPA